jgi:hypothetical protein
MAILDSVSRVLKWTFEQARNELHDYNIRRLVEQAYNDDQTTRTLVRIKLKTKYPEVFSMLEAK